MTDKVKVLKIDTDPAQKSVKELRQELKDLKDTLLSTTKGTDEYNKALRQAADIQHTLKEQMEEVNASAMDFGQIVGNTTKAVGGMVAGIQAAKATLNLFGVENEEVVKSLQKMQNLMAITQALPAIDNGVKAFKRLKIAIEGASAGMSGLKKALISTGLGALVVTLGLLAANWDKVSGAMKRWGIINEDTAKKLEEQKKKVEELRGELAKLEGSYDDWEKQQKYSKLNSTAKKSYDDLTESITRYQKQLDIIVAKQKLPENQSRENWQALQNEGLELSKNISKLKNQQEAILANADSYKQEEKAIRNVAAAKDENAKMDEAAYKQTLDRIDAEERAEILSLQNQALKYDEYISKKEALEDRFIKYRIDALKNILSTETGLTDEEIQRLEEKLIRLQDSLRKKPEGEETPSPSPESEGESKAKQISEAINASALALNDFSNNPAWSNILKNVAILSANWDTLHKQIQEGGKKAFSAYAQIAATALSAVAQLMNGLAAEQDTSNKEGFESAKKFQIAGATMSMFAGIASAWASSMQLGPIAGPILGAVLSAFMLTTGLLQIMKIKNTKFESKGSSAGSSPSAGAVTNVIAPVQYTQDVQGANIEGAIKDSKVYVTETDISNTQKKVDVAESEARY